MLTRSPQIESEDKFLCVSCTPTSLYIILLSLQAFPTHLPSFATDVFAIGAFATTFATSLTPCPIPLVPQTNVQKNMRAGTYNTGALHPQREAGVIYFQSLVRKALLAHRELEQAAGHPIYPAKFQQRGETQEDKFCAELEGAACGGEDKRLAW